MYSSIPHLLHSYTSTPYHNAESNGKQRELPYKKIEKIDCVVFFFFFFLKIQINNKILKEKLNYLF